MQLEYSTIKQALILAAKSLEKVGIERSLFEARLIMEYALNLSREQLIINENRKLSSEELQRFEELIQKRAERVPFAQIIGKKEFWGIEFLVNEHTLIPRPESELIVTSVLELAHKEANFNILDLGTGSGCLLLSILSELPHASGIGIDKSKEAIAIAEKNSINHGLEYRTRFLNIDWNNYKDDKFDIVIANPPYISLNDKEKLQPEVLKDPHSALFADNNGLVCYEQIANLLPNFLIANGYFICEIGHNQAAQIIEIFKKNYNLIEKKKDYAGLDRVLIFKSNLSN